MKKHTIDMKTITFHCQTITPMFLAGADGKTPELRPPSIKGALRFWWRAMNANLVKQKNGGTWDYSKLKEEETKIFGGTGEKVGRSKVMISTKLISKDIRKEFISTTPHHQDCLKEKKQETGCYFGKNDKNKRCSKSVERDVAFPEFCLNMVFDENVISKNELDPLIRTTFLLGGFGKRARRGFGSIWLKNENLDATDVDKIFKKAKKECSDYCNEPDFRKRPDYPFILDTLKGKFNGEYKKLLIDIGETSHAEQDNSLGFARGKKRLASPIYSTIIRLDSNYQILHTKLNSVFPSKTKKNIHKQTNYINKLL